MKYTEQQVIDLYTKEKRGMSEIYKITGCSSATQIRILKRHGIHIRSRNETRQVNLSEKELQYLYIEQKLSMGEIAKLKNTSPNTVLNYLRKYNIESRKIFWTEDNLEACKKLLLSGKTYKEVGLILEVTDNAVDNINKNKLRIKNNFWEKRLDQQDIKNFLAKSLNYQLTAKTFNVPVRALKAKNNREWLIDLSSNSTLYGQPTVFNGIKYRSKTESEIAEFLFAKNIRFEYEKRVRSWSCDFYLTDYDCWIEYDGLGKNRKDIEIYNYDNHPKIRFYRDNKYKFYLLPKQSWLKHLNSLLSLLNQEPKSPYGFEIRPIDRKIANSLLDYYHYLGSAPKNDKYFYGLFYQGFLVGCCSFGIGANKHLSNSMGGKTLQLTRLFTLDWLPKNSLSFFLSKAVKMLHQTDSSIRHLVSFADPSVGHTGAIYKACNWKFAYQCKKDYKYRLPDGSLVHKSKFRCKGGLSEKELAGSAGAIKIIMQGKLKFTYSVF